MAEDAQIVEQDMMNDLADLGISPELLQGLFAPVMSEPDEEEPSGGFFSPPRRYVDLSNSPSAPRSSPLDFSPQFGPGAGQRHAEAAGPRIPPMTAMLPGANELAYVDSDAPAELARMDPAILARLQDRMAALGLSVGTRGVPDNETLSGFRELLAMSNARGEKWNFTLAALENAAANNALPPISEDGTRSLEGYVAPDYKAIGLEVRNRFRQALGRDPTEGELRLFSNEMMAGASVMAQQEAAKAAAENAAQGPLPGDDVGTPEIDPDEVGAHGPLNEPTSMVDPMTKFEEMFAQKVSSEESMLRRSDETSQSAGLARSNIERSAGGA